MVVFKYNHLKELYDLSGMDYVTYYIYDGRNCLTAQWMPFANGKYTYQAFTYDKNSSLKTSGIGTEEVSLWGIPATLLTTYYEYDECGRQLSVTEPAGSNTTYEYDPNGNVAKETVAIDEVKSRITEYEYNYLGQVSKMKQTVSGLEQTTTYTYDVEGNLLTTTDWLGNIFTNSYDAVGRLTSTIDPYEKTIVENKYDDAGNKMTTSDALGNETVNQYDQRGRLIQITDPLGNITS